MNKKGEVDQNNNIVLLGIVGIVALVGLILVSGNSGSNKITGAPVGGQGGGLDCHTQYNNFGIATTTCTNNGGVTVLTCQYTQTDTGYDLNTCSNAGGQQLSQQACQQACNLYAPSCLPPGQFNGGDCSVCCSGTCSSPDVHYC